jgi:hypothetical protein
MKSQIEVEKESQSALCGIHFVEFASTAGFRIISLSVVTCACFLIEAGTYFQTFKPYLYSLWPNGL